MTRTGKSPRLATHIDEPYVEIHPQDALLAGVRDGRLARVATRWGACVVRAKVSADVPRRQLFVPIHWNGRTASDARVGALVNPVVDPVSGEPEFKHTPAGCEPFEVDWYGFVLARQPLPALEAGDAHAPSWWARAQGAQFVRYELAGRGQPPHGDWSAWARMLLEVAHEDHWLDASDAAEGLYRGADSDGESLRACLFISPRPDALPPRAWLSSLMSKPALDEADQVALLVGHPATPVADVGPTVCSCFGVGRNPILAAIRGGCATPEALGAQLRCGTNCGSCIPELKVLIATAAAAGAGTASVPRSTAISPARADAGAPSFHHHRESTP
jgi:assimilatory nitrate reductase catalytic subunit